ncbi:MAG: hypothetical protein KDK70_39390 [Myxococcales bacterium]|nr:hypothetical protein [Myxococcales bacterium]
MPRRSRAGAWLWGGLLLACTPADEQPTTGASSSSSDASSDASGTTGEGTGTGTAGSSGSSADATDSTGPTSSTGDDTGASSSGDAESSGSTGGDDGLGMLSGECGLIDAMELQSPEPFTFLNAIDFRRVGFDYDQLTPEGQAVFDAGNLGGSSLHSEVISFEVLARCEGASLLATEAEIQYVDPMGTKTDLRVEIDGLPVGVSVTRAVGFPPDDPYTPMQASTLLGGKLDDILASTANVAPGDAWVKQILHVIAYADMHAQSILEAYAALPPETTADTILLITVTHGNDAFVY